MADDIQLVVARFNENLDWVEKLNLPAVVYNKGEPLRHALPVPSWGPAVPLENKGREADTYLRHILRCYDSLPEITVFLQGDPFPHCRDLQDRLSKLRGYTELGHVVTPDDHRDFPKRVKSVLWLLKKMDVPVPDVFKFPKGAQYAVPRSMIVGKPWSWWRDLHGHMAVSKSTPWWLEMAWPSIFNHRL